MLKQCMTIIWLASLVLIMPWQVQAQEEEYPFETDEQREQFRTLRAEMRCPKCLNSNLAGSDAPVAQELTDNIYQQIREGRSNEDIIEFMTSRYGEFINYRPSLTTGTFFLWFGPVMLLLAGLFIVWRMARNNPRESARLSTEDEQKLQRILSEE